MPVQLLWLDDEITSLDTFVEKLAEFSFVVSTATDVESAEQIVDGNEIDICLVDLNLGGTSGIEFLRRVGRDHPGMTFVALSSYLYRKTYLDQLYALQFPVKIMDKTLPSRDSDDFTELFVQPILEYHNSTKKLTPKAAQRKSASVVKKDPFSVTYADWRNMDVFQRDQLQDAAYEKAKGMVEKAFEDGDCWVMLCGSSDVLRATAKRPSEILADNQLMEFGLRQGFVPFCYYRQGQIEELWGGVCTAPEGEEDAYRGYPTVRFSVGPDMLDFHFDTGSDISYFSYDELRIRNQTENVLHWYKMNLRHHERRDIRIIRREIKFLLHCQESGDETIFVTLNAAIVRNWPDFPYVRFCGTACIHGHENNARICKFRKGLVGRDLVVENQIKLILDGALGRTSFASETRE